MLATTLQLIALLVLVVLTAVDMLQTLTIANQPHRWHERNPLLRWLMNRYPPGARRDGIVIAYFIAAVAVMVTMAIYAAREYHWSLFLAVAGWFAVMELYCVLMNHRHGIAATDPRSLRNIEFD